MGKIKDIKKAQPQPVKGLWWFKITLDSGEEVVYSHESEEPFKPGDELPPYEVKETATGRGGSVKMLVLLPPKPDPAPVSEYTYEAVDKTTTILSAKARACIDAMGYAATIAPLVGKKPSEIYPFLVKSIHGELDKL